MIIKLLNTVEKVLKKDYGFDEVFNTFNGIDNKHNKLNEYNSRTPDKIDAKNVMLEYLKFLEDRLIDIFSINQMRNLKQYKNLAKSSHSYKDSMPKLSHHNVFFLRYPLLL